MKRILGKLILALAVVLFLPLILYGLGSIQPTVFQYAFLVGGIACVGMLFRPLKLPVLGDRWWLASLAIAFLISSLSVMSVMTDADLAELREEEPAAYLDYLEANRSDADWLAELEVLAPDAFAREMARREEEEAAEAERQRARAEERENARLAAEAGDIEVYIERLSRELSSLRNFDATNWTGDYDRIVLGAGLFSIWGSIYREGADLSLTSDQEALRQEFRRHLIREQRESFPVLRDRFGPAARQRLWIADASARTIGTGYRTVEFVAGDFAANSNIQAFQIEMRDVFRLLRFKQSRYKWYPESDRYTYYNLNTPDDDDIVYLSGNRIVVYSE